MDEEVWFPKRKDQWHLNVVPLIEEGINAGQCEGAFLWEKQHTEQVILFPLSRKRKGLSEGYHGRRNE